MDYFNKMDGAGGYVRASLLGLSQGMSHLHDPLRLHPALHSQISEAGKEGSGLLRPLSDYSHIPLLPFTPPFLHPQLDPRLPFSPSAFHPLHAHASKLPPVVSSSGLNNNNCGVTISSSNTTNTSNSLHGSAFSPLPAKCSKLDPDVSSQSIFSHSNILASLEHRNHFLGGPSPPAINSEDRRDSPSPRESHGSRESPGHARDADTPNSGAEENRARKLRPGENWCPICGIVLRAGEYEAHYAMELEKVCRLPVIRPNGTGSHSVSSIPTSGIHPSASPLGHHSFANTLTKSKDPGWETYQRIRTNRLLRLRAKKRRSGRGDECAACPVCGDRINAATTEEFNQHVEHCLRRQGGNEEEVVDVEGDGCDDFDWCGQRRIRASSLLRATTALHGRDTEGVNSPEKDSVGNTSGDSGATGSGSSSNCEAMEKELEELREKVKNMERTPPQNNNRKYICQVCNNEYDRPTVSVVCWHVMCEACWGHSLGVKSECPQCSQSVARDDLRPLHL